VQAALRLKDAQDRSASLQHRLMAGNQELEKSLASLDGDLLQTRNALVLALGKLAELRVSEDGQRLVRLQHYVRALAEETARSSPYTDQISPSFIDLLVCCVPLHDIGKVGLPDHIVLKPGKLDADERLLMQAHTSLGAETLEKAGGAHEANLPFLRTAIEIARHHHERFDGRGYPDRLSGTQIPLTARLVSLCDVYDALRSRRVYKPALSHAAALQVMLEGSPGQFDPDLLPAFHRCGSRFEEIFREILD
jgi:response regulator RpfG family c-di-GMP phosphodiesterase